MCLANYSLLEQLRLNHIFTKGQKIFPCWSLNHWQERSQRQAPGSNTTVQTSWEVLAVLGEGNLKLPCPTAPPTTEASQAAGWLPGGTCLRVPCSEGKNSCQGSLGLPRAYGRPRSHFYHCTDSFEICYHTQGFAPSKPTSACVIFYTNTLS